MILTPQELIDHLRAVPVASRKLFLVIVRQAYHGPLRSKAKGTATSPEILEACGLGVDEYYAMLVSLKNEGLIEVLGAYPFEEIRLSENSVVAKEMAEASAKAGTPLESVFVSV